MTSTSVWPFGRGKTDEGKTDEGKTDEGKTDEGDGFFAPALYLSIAIAISAVITQGLASAGVVGLDTAQMATIWLWVAGLIVLLWIAYMICRAYVTPKNTTDVEQLKDRAEEAQAKAAQWKDRAEEAEAKAAQWKDRAEKAEAKAAAALAEARKAEKRVEEALKGLEEALS